MSPEDPTSNPESVKCLRRVSLSRVQHPPLEHTTLTENYIAAATAPHVGSAMTCQRFDRKFWPSVKVMDRLTMAADVAVEAADVVDVEDVEDVEDEEDNTRQRNASWRSSKLKMQH
jgi:hypothetical protein